MDRVEVNRQLFHLCNGIIILLAFSAFGKVVGWILLLLSVGGLILSLYHVHVSPIKWAEPLLQHLERKENERFPGKGAIIYGLGVAFTILFFHEVAVKAGILCLTFGDAASTIVGKVMGRRPIPWNKKLSLEGSIAFVVVSFIASMFLLPFKVALFASVFGALVETIPEIDDNFSIPLLVGAGVQILFG
ncbi:conserved hypothetical protein [Thermosulfidibacter takaii ABI70S6]|uniref:Phosphatidate cytidylyltransferase n=1 Tax=Thermosulfidibacter takaii (strain DSM 17441 / JCM 13301 / NBRC 103674 / ABI70S6) TaxID=1298851 RepID=A0A0S3QVQ8_THET7|nr:diacylglycerol/polyprenol kinase family protein [Thermosulfidibacter takaii]BAT72413.1 conserved hypothetical protein [Thermosulfidibacter takaii ABI70S6]